MNGFENPLIISLYLAAGLSLIVEPLVETFFAPPIKLLENFMIAKALRADLVKTIIKACFVFVTMGLGVAGFFLVGHHPLSIEVMPKWAQSVLQGLIVGTGSQTLHAILGVYQKLKDWADKAKNNPTDLPPIG